MNNAYYALSAGAAAVAVFAAGLACAHQRNETEAIGSRMTEGAQIGCGFRSKVYGSLLNAIEQNRWPSDRLSTWQASWPGEDGSFIPGFISGGTQGPERLTERLSL